MLSGGVLWRTTLPWEAVLCRRGRAGLLGLRHSEETLAAAANATKAEQGLRGSSYGATEARTQQNKHRVRVYVV